MLCRRRSAPYRTSRSPAAVGRAASALRRITIRSDFVIGVRCMAVDPRQRGRRAVGQAGVAVFVFDAIGVEIVVLADQLESSGPKVGPSSSKSAGKNARPR